MESLDEGLLEAAFMLDPQQPYVFFGKGEVRVTWTEHGRREGESTGETAQRQRAETEFERCGNRPWF